MVIRSLALRTQAAIQQMYGIVEINSDYAVFRTPAVPDFWYGHCLVMPAAPQLGDYESWMARFAHEFPDKTHRVFLIDDPAGSCGDTAAFEQVGFEISRHEVLAAEKIKCPARLNDAWHYRPAASSSDWQSVIETAFLTNQGLPGFDLGFLERKFAAVRRVVSEGRGAWWGAWDGKTNIAHMGLFWQDGLVRFQGVATHPAYRRQGLCRTLLYQACRAVEQIQAPQSFVILPEDAAVSRIYQSVGFRCCEMSADFCRTPPVSNGN